MKTYTKATTFLTMLFVCCLGISRLHAQTAYNLTVKSGPLRQSFAGFGASQASTTWNNINQTARNTMADMVYRDLKMNVLRLWVTTTTGTTANPSLVSVPTMLSAFNTAYVASGAIADIKNRGVTTLLLAPAQGYPGYPPASLSDYANNLAELILEIKNTYNVQIDVTGVSNEPSWSTANIVDCVKYLRADLDSRGLTNVKILAPESIAPSDAVPFAEALSQDSSAWGDLLAIASHSYSGVLWNNDMEACKLDKQWWTTEASADPSNELAEDENQACTILSRFLCEVNHGSDKWVFFIGLGQNADVSTWPLNTAYMMMYDIKTASIVTFLKYYYFKQALSTLDVGCVFRKCSSSTEGDMFGTSLGGGHYQQPAINAAAAYNPDGSWGINVVNDTGVTGAPAAHYSTFYSGTTYNVTVTVEELANTPSMGFSVYRSKANNHFVTCGTLTLTNGVGTFAIAPRELVSLRSGSTAAAIASVPDGLTASALDGPVALAWNNTARATSWNIKRATVSGGPYTTIATTTTTSYDDSTAINGTVYYYVVSGVNSLGESANSTEVMATPTPFPWSNTDIGTVAIAGSCAFSDLDNTFTSYATGTSLGYTTDSFNYTYQTMTGDGTLIARVAKASNANAKVGILMSETLGTSPKAAYLIYNFTPSWNKVMMSKRSTAGGAGSWTVSSISGVPAWLKLVRSGSTFTGYASADGASWTTVSSGVISMANTIYMGMANCATGTTALNKGYIDNVSTPCAAPTDLHQTSACPAQISLNWTASWGATSYNIKRATISGGPYTTVGTAASPSLNYIDTTVASGMIYYYVVSAVNAMGASANSAELMTWSNMDIGTVATTGSCIISGSGPFTTYASGTALGYTNDSFNYTFKPMTGDGTLIARIVSADTTQAYMAKVGIMMSETLGTSPKAAYLIYNFNSGWNQIMMSKRSTAGIAGSWTASGISGVPSWLKLVRSGNVFTGYASTDGTNWTTVSSGTITMANTIYIGLADCATGNASCRAVIDSVRAPGE